MTSSSHNLLTGFAVAGIALLISFLVFRIRRGWRDSGQIGAGALLSLWLADLWSTVGDRLTGDAGYDSCDGESGGDCGGD